MFDFEGAVVLLPESRILGRGGIDPLSNDYSFPRTLLLEPRVIEKRDRIAVFAAFALSS